MSTVATASTEFQGKVASRKLVAEFLESIHGAADHHRQLNLVEFAPPGTGLQSADPFTAGYRQKVLEQYLLLSGNASYDPYDNERDNYLQPTDSFQIYPYTTADPICVGSYLAGIGIALRAMQVPPGGRIIEYGVGWGHTALHMAMLGYQVTAVDIEARFLESLELRAKRIGLDIELHHGEFGDSPCESSQYDGILFYECFHHWLNHHAGMSRLFEMLAPGGRMVLAGEPLFGDAWHYPWGLRMDGQSLRAITEHGWMELGFQRSYLEQLLVRNGFQIERHFHPELDIIGEAYVGIKPQ